MIMNLSICISELASDKSKNVRSLNICNRVTHVKRRRFLTTAAPFISAPALWHTVIRPRRSVEVRYWLSPKAGQYAVQDRINEYVKAALARIVDADVSFGGIVPVHEEHGYHVTRSGEWPHQLYLGQWHANDIDPASDVNLLVTDGSLHRGPTGLAQRRLASIGGARHLERLPPRDEIDDTVDYRLSFFAMHLLIHEIGHVLGLRHEHGEIDTVEDGTVASPMVSTYAWMDETDQFSGD